MVSRRNSTLTAMLIWLLVAGCTGQRLVRHASDLPSGAWEEASGHQKVRFEPDRIVVAEDRSLKAMRILQRAPGTLILRDEGIKETWTISLEEDVLRFGHDGRIQTYRPMAKASLDLDLTPLPLGDPSKLSPQEIKNIQNEITRRRDRDQAVRKDPKLKEEWAAVDADNFAYLTSLVQQVGWIDTAHFGKQATAAAIIIAKHSSDPRLMQAILPSVEKDMTYSGISAELFSVLYDESRLTLGYKQRYGTQLAEDKAGPYVVPLEEPDRVDELRKAIALPPLAEYLATASKYLYDGKPIRILSDK
jgi:hypothetical protein